MFDNDEIKKDQTDNGQDVNTQDTTQQHVTYDNDPAQQESAATEETQYRFSKNDIPFNNEQSDQDNHTFNNDQVNNNGQSFNSNQTYSNAQSYNNGQYNNGGYANNNSYQNGYNYSYNNNAYNNGYNESAQYGNTGYGYNNQQDQQNQQNQQSNPYYNNMNQNTTAKHKNHTKKNGRDFMKNKVVRLVASACVFGIIAGGIMFGIYCAGVSIWPQKRTSTYEIQTVSPNMSTTAQIEGEGSTSTGMNVEAVAQAALPAMVELNGTTKVSGSSYGFWGQQAQEAQTSGTGIIVGKNESELLILTNAHVIEGVSNLSCSFVDGEAVEASVKGSKTDKDIAVVAVDLNQIKDSTLNSIAIAELGESDDVVLGQQVVAIGNALGEGQSVTAGIVSALDRSITVNNVTFSGLFLTDAAINSGNSGGAMLDAAGKVVGINFAKTSESGVEGMAYSIPVSTVRDLIDSLMTRQKRSMVSDDKASYLGISAVDITSSIAQQYSYPQGVMINQVVSGSAAEKAGLGSYDIVVSFDDQTITSMSGLQSIMKYYEAGETVKIEYYHIEGNEYVLKSVDVTLGKKN